MNDLNDQLRKMEDDIYRGELEAKILSIVVWGTVEKSTGWEENLTKNEETLRGQQVVLNAQLQECSDDDSLKKDSFCSVLCQLESLAQELIAFRASFQFLNLFFGVLCYQITTHIMSYMVVFFVINILDILMYLAFRLFALWQ